MVPNIVRLLAGLSVSEVATTRLGLVIILAGQKWVTMTSYDLALIGIKRTLLSGYYICIKIPLWALKTFWKTQMFLLSLPYRCFQCLLCALRNSISGLVDPPIRAATQKILQEFLTKQNSENSMQKTESSGGVEAFNSEIRPSKNKDKVELEKRIEEETGLAKEEKKLLRMIVAALKYVKRLKGSRAVFDEQFKQTLEDLINISKSLSEKAELNESMEDSGFNRKPQKRLHKQVGLLQDLTEKRQKRYYDASYTCPSKLTFTNESINASALKRADSELVCISMEALKSIVYVLKAENFALKRRLKFTTDQLGGVKTTSKCLADKVTDLEVHLDKIKELLKTTEEERDEMCFKLFALSDIIEEQETVLNDSSRRNNMDSLYSTTLDYLLSEEANFDLHAFNTENIF